MGFDMDGGSGAASRIDLFKDSKEKGTVFETPELDNVTTEVVYIHQSSYSSL
jgi:cytochrome c peroxidase